MVSRVEDYGYLLNELKELVLANPLKTNLSEEEFVIKSVFAINYFHAYLYMLNKRGKQINANTIKRDVFSDYQTFNSLMNNFAKEKEMYDDIGTGEMIYFPNHELVEYFFNERMNALKNYLDIVFKQKTRVK